jgi:hypothetical protein
VVAESVLVKHQLLILNRLFRCKSLILRAHWVLVVMDQCTRRIVGFGVHRGAVDGVVLCRMFNRATRGHTRPTDLSSDHDRLYRWHQWQANLRIMDVEEIKTVVVRKYCVRPRFGCRAPIHPRAETRADTGSMRDVVLRTPPAA